MIDGDSFLAAAQKSSNSKLRAFSKSLWDAEDADLYIDSQRGYPVWFSGSYSGTYEPLEFEGDFDIQIELTGINTNPWWTCLLRVINLSHVEIDLYQMIICKSTDHKYQRAYTWLNSHH